MRMNFALLSPFVVAALSIGLGFAACGGQSSAHSGQGTDGGAEATIAEAGDEAETDGAADAPPDVDNGAPSNVYPAAHPPLPTLVNNAGGPVLGSPKVYLVFYPGYPYETDLETFAQKMTTSTYWATATQQYGVGALSYAGVIELTGQTAPSMIASTDIQTWVGSQIQTGVFGTPDPQAIYTVFYPQGTVITQPNPVSTLLPGPQSCSSFGGYHDNASVALTDGGTPANFAYAVIPTCTTAVNDLTAVLSHEWVEASTDPFLTSSGNFTLTGGPDAAFYSVDQNHIIWDLLGGGEAGDLCEPEAPDVYISPADIGYQVQRIWSNQAAAGSHDPCAPDISGAFFDSAPVLTEMVTFTSSITGSVTSQGVTIPVGSSKTIEVDLFSDGDTGGPWSVSAADVLSTYYGSYGLTPSMTFAWDRTQGQNGEKLHLTITVTTASIIGGGHAFMITSQQGSRTAVWPGLVVE